MTIFKNLTLITGLCIITASTTLYNAPQQPADEMQTTAIKKIIEFKNSMDTYCQPIKPYIYNPVGFAGSCLLSSIVGFRKIVITIGLGCVIAGSNEIIKRLDDAEKTAHKEKK